MKGPIGSWRLADLGVVLMAVIAATSSFAPTDTLVWGVPIAFVLWLLNVWTAGLRLPDVLGLVTVVMGYVSVTWAVRPDYALDTARLYAGLVVFFLAIRALCRTRRHVLTLAGGFFAGAVWSVVLIIRENGIRFGARPSNAVERYGLEGINYNYTAYAAVMAMVCAVVLWRYSEFGGAARVLWRVVLAALSLLLGYGVLLAGTRTGLLGIGLLLLWLVSHRFAPRPALLAIAGGVTVFGIAVVTGAMDTLLVERLDFSARATGDLSNRIPIWNIARELWHDHPVFGVGAGGYQALSPFQVGTHNVLLEYATSFGVIGLVLAAAFFSACLLDRMNMLRIEDRALVLGAFIAGIGPAYLGGQWISAVSGWIGLAVVSTLSRVAPVVAEDQRREEDVVSASPGLIVTSRSGA